jgi:hypothetical protein
MSAPCVDVVAVVIVGETLPRLQLLKRTSIVWLMAARRVMRSDAWLDLADNSTMMEAELENIRNYRRLALPLRLVRITRDLDEALTDDRDPCPLDDCGPRLAAYDVGVPDDATATLETLVVAPNEWRNTWGPRFDEYALSDPRCHDHEEECERLRAADDGARSTALHLWQYYPLSGRAVPRWAGRGDGTCTQIAIHRQHSERVHTAEWPC